MKKNLHDHTLAAPDCAVDHNAIGYESRKKFDNFNIIPHLFETKFMETYRCSFPGSPHWVRPCDEFPGGEWAQPVAFKIELYQCIGKQTSTYIPQRHCFISNNILHCGIE